MKNNGTHLRRLLAMAKRGRELAQMGGRPGKSVEAVRRKLETIRGHQYLRSLLDYHLEAEPGGVQFRTWSERSQYQRLLDSYFGLRILIIDRSAWSDGSDYRAYRGQ